MPNQVTFTLQEVKLPELSAAVQALVGAAPGRLLRFEHARLAKAEVNQNQDEIDSQGINEICATLPLTALDDEHDRQKVVGYYTDARPVDDMVDCDGLIFADRFPEQARDVMEGRKQLSIEAGAKEAQCSMCGKTFTNEKDYCAHINTVSAKKSSGAKRILRGLVAEGGAITKNPAGTGTTFDQKNIHLYASVHQLNADTSLVDAGDIMSCMNEVEYSIYGAMGEDTNEAMAKVLTTKERNAMSDEQYALIQYRPSKRDPKKKLKIRRFPIGDRKHAANALSRAPQGKDMTPEERRMVINKARRALKKFGGEPGDNKAASRVLAQIFEQDYGDLTRYNPQGYYQISSPVLAPVLFINNPSWVKEIASKQTAPTDTTSVLQPLEASIREIREVLQAKVKELEEKNSALEVKLAATNHNDGGSQPGAGLTGLSWADAERPNNGKPNTKVSWI